MKDAGLLPGLPVELIRAAYAAAPGNELESGKFTSPESSAALVANVFGLFLDRPADMPMLREGQDCEWPPTTVRLEAIVRFPWAGGRGDEVIFQVATYRELLRAWDVSPIAAVRAHVAAVRRRFDL